MSCQCEIYEICPQCAPSPQAFVKAVKDHDDVIRRVSLSKSYTLDDLEQLARRYANGVKGGINDDLTIGLTLSTFLAWLRKREREVGDGD